MRYPSLIRPEHDAYAVPTTTFHLAIHAHAKITSWTDAVGNAIWQSVLDERERPGIEL